VLIIVNRDLPPAALQTLQSYGTILPFHSEDVTYPALQGHADLYIAELPPSDDTQHSQSFVVAPNLPSYCLSQLTLAGKDILQGTTTVGSRKESYGAYNIAIGDLLAIGNPKQCDAVLSQKLAGHQFVAVQQGMARCTSLCIADRAVITSDAGIHKALLAEKITSLLVSCQEIKLPGYPCGCFGGCCGITGDKVFLMGSLRYHPQGEEIRTFLQQNKKETVELYDGPLLDVGSIFFL
jgi:hypothetical protein